MDQLNKSQILKQLIIILVIGILIGLIIGGLIWILVRQPSGTPIVLSTRVTDNQITVYVSGQVVSPGVFQIPHGSRVIDAINAAGGTIPSADIDYLNMAEILSDSDHILVPSIPMVGELVVSKININYATQTQLESLPGIGAVFAKNIIDFRNEFGLFTKIEEIQKVPGIGPATFEEIKNSITVGE